MGVFQSASCLPFPGAAAGKYKLEIIMCTSKRLNANLYTCIALGLRRYIDISICHDINGFDRVCHGSQAISIRADNHIFLFNNSVANVMLLFYEICACVYFKTSIIEYHNLYVVTYCDIMTYNFMTVCDIDLGHVMAVCTIHQSFDCNLVADS